MSRKQITVALVMSIGLFVLLGWLFQRDTVPDYDKREREVHLEMIKRNSDRIARLSLDSLRIRQKMYSDSLKHIVELRAKDEAYLKQRKHYESINLSRATSKQLDSLRARLLTLHAAGTVPRNP